MSESESFCGVAHVGQVNGRVHILMQHGIERGLGKLNALLGAHEVLLGLGKAHLRFQQIIFGDHLLLKKIARRFFMRLDLRHGLPRHLPKLLRLENGEIGGLDAVDKIIAGRVVFEPRHIHAQLFKLVFIVNFSARKKRLHQHAGPTDTHSACP